MHTLLLLARRARSQTLAAAGLAGALAAAQLMTMTAAWLTSATLKLDQGATTLDLLISLSPLSLLALGVLTAVVPRHKLAWGLAAVNLLALIGAAALPRSTGALQAAAGSLPVLLTFGLVLLANLGVSTALVWQLGQQPHRQPDGQVTGQIDPRVLLTRAAALTASMAVGGVLTSEYLSRSLQGAQEHAAWTLLLAAATTSLLCSAGLIWMSWRRQNERTPNTEAPSTEAPSTEAPSTEAPNTETQDEAPDITPLSLTPRLLLIAFALTSLGWWLLSAALPSVLRSSGAHTTGVGRWSAAQLTALAAPLLGAAWLWALSLAPRKALSRSLMLLAGAGIALGMNTPLMTPQEAWAPVDWSATLGVLGLYAARLTTVACGLAAAWQLSKQTRHPAVAGLLIGAALAGESAGALITLMGPNLSGALSLQLPLSFVAGSLICAGAGLIGRRAMKSTTHD